MRGSNPQASPLNATNTVFQTVPAYPAGGLHARFFHLGLPSTFALLAQLHLPVQLLDARVERAVLAREFVRLLLRVGHAHGADVLDLAACVAILRDRGGLRQLSVEAVAQC